MRRRLFLLLLALVSALVLAGCRLPHPAEPLRQRGYLWQRSWTPAVVDAVFQADAKLDGVILLGAEIVWKNGQPQVIRADLPWDALRPLRGPCALALRMAPRPGGLQPADAALLAETAKTLLATARNHGVRVAELQLDYDAPQRQLAAYRTCLPAVRAAIRPARLIITTLPAWLAEPEFAALAREADAFVLQVHSVPTLAESGRASLCDPRLARKWVAQASRLGLPFSVALPTYRCLAGYDPAGKLLSVAMDSVQPAWPAGTSTLDFAADADELAALVHEWREDPRRGFREIIWYRLPVATDTRNWRWPTLSAVIAGRRPVRRAAVVRSGENPVDLVLRNAGEAELRPPLQVEAVWQDAKPSASDALPGWDLRVENGRAVFSSRAGQTWQLSPGDERGIGWLRYDRPTPLQTKVVEDRSVP